MSLILEALRKSEAERRRGSTPDVAMELPPAALRRTQATPAWLWPLALFAVVALLAAWWWSRRDGGTPASDDTLAAVALPEPSIDVPAPPVVVARPAPTQDAPATASLPVAVSTPPAPVSRIPVPAPAPVPAPVRALPPPAPALAPPDIDATSLPAAKLSMHMWDAAPGKRFVILDGQRMGEGDRNGEVTVIAIERDGVVVERNGQRARVPLP